MSLLTFFFGRSIAVAVVIISVWARRAFIFEIIHIWLQKHLTNNKIFLLRLQSTDVFHKRIMSADTYTKPFEKQSKPWF